jgi:LysR family glycine cleavage system transcriptional activator
LLALRAFEASARLMSFSLAARELGVTPGAISQQIRLIEAWVGAPLFRRVGRGVRLTEAAEAALPLVHAGFSHLAEAGHRLRAPPGQARVVLAAPTEFAARWLIPRLGALMAALPAVEVWLTPLTSGVSANDAFADVGLDLVMDFAWGPLEGLRGERLIDEAVLPVLAPALAAGISTPTALAGCPLIHHDEPASPGWAGWFSRSGLPLPEASGLRFGSEGLALEAARAGLGVALARRALVLADLQAGRLVAPLAAGGMGLPGGWWLFWPKGRTQRGAVREVQRWLQAEAQASEGPGV